VGPSPELPARLIAHARSVHVQVDVLVGGVDELVALLDDRRFYVVCAHGLLMDLRDVDTVVASLAAGWHPVDCCR
jgi:hypothetical protein